MRIWDNAALNLNFRILGPSSFPYRQVIGKLCFSKRHLWLFIRIVRSVPLWNTQAAASNSRNGVRPGSEQLKRLS